MSKQTRLFSTGHTLEHDGKTYKVEPLDLERIEQFSAWIEEQLWAAHRRSRRVLSPEEYDKNGASLLERIGSGKWTYPQPQWFEVLFTLPGLSRAVLLGLSNTHPEVDEELADEIVMAQYDRCVQELLEIDPNETNADPTRPAADPVPA